jgi:hypothetical protein
VILLPQKALMFASDGVANRRLPSGVNYGIEYCYGQPMLERVSGMRRCARVNVATNHWPVLVHWLSHDTVGSAGHIISTVRTVGMICKEGAVA